MTPDFVESYSPEAFDFTGDPSIRARTAFDFGSDPQVTPPVLPPKKKRDTEPSHPRERHPDRTAKIDYPGEEPPRNIFQVKDKTASLGRGMWSDDDEDFEPYRKNSSLPNRYPEPDRIIDFSKSPDGEHSLKRSRSERRKHPTPKRPRSRGHSRTRSPHRPGHRVLDFSGNPYIDPHNGVNTQAMVSLHSNRQDTDAYDSVRDTGDELDNLIDKANSLGYHHNYLKPSEDIYQRVAPKEKKLGSRHPEAFAKIVAPLTNKPSAAAHRPYAPPNENIPRKSSKSNQRRYRRESPPTDSIEGDDETSVTESDLERVAPTQRLPSASLPFVTEIYPTTNTEFESYSEAEFPNPKKYDRTSSFVTDDTTLDFYRPKAATPRKRVYISPSRHPAGRDSEDDIAVDLNPIVSSNFQICSDIAASKSFPARIREGKPKSQRPTLEHVAIPLNQASKNRQAYPTSLPYFGNEFDSDYDGFKRSGSVDDLYPIHKPSIVVHRQPIHPSGGYDPDVVPAVLVQSNPYPKKEKRKKEKTEPIEKVVPQINLKVDGEPNNINNNLQINLLPSSDPNIINLNIKSSSVNPSGPQSLPITSSQTEAKVPLSTQPASLRSDSQHRVVDVNASPLLHTGNSDPSTAYFENGGVFLAAGVPMEILPYPQTASSSHISPTMSFGPPQFPPPLPATQSLPPIASAPQPAIPMINTHVSTPPAQQQQLQIRDEPIIVNVEAPWPTERSTRSLPESGKSRERMNRGDSGIDLSMHEHRRSRRSREDRKRSRSVSRSSSRRRSSVASSDRGSKRRSSSKRNLKTHDYLGGTTPTREYMEWYKDKYLKPSCCYVIMKHIAVFINIIFLLAGLGLAGFSIWGMVELHHAEVAELPLIALDPLFAVMIVGIVTTVVSVTGAGGFIRDNIWMLRLFTIFLVSLFIIFIAGGITFWAMMERVNNFIIETAVAMIEHYNPENRVAMSFLINFVQDTFTCCGVTGPKDWSKNEIFNKCTEEERCLLPDSCCPITQDPSLKCTSSSELSHHLTCDMSLASVIRNNTPIVVGIWIGIWALMMIELVFSYFMCKEIRYLRKIRDFTDNPVKYMEKVQRKAPKGDDYENDSSERSSEEATETSSSEEEYRRKRRNRKRANRNRSRGRKKKRGRAGHRRTGSHHVNRSYFIHDETQFHRTRSHRDSRRRERSRSRRRDSF